MLAHFRSSGVVFVSGLFLFNFRIEFEAPIQPPLLVACPVPQLVSELGWGFQYLNRFENHSATMASLGKIPVFSGEDYAYWKVRMRAFLQSMGAEVWDIIKAQQIKLLLQVDHIWIVLTNNKT